MIKYWAYILLSFSIISEAKSKIYEKVDVIFYNSKSSLNSSYFLEKTGLVDLLIERAKSGQLDIYGENRTLISNKTFSENFTYLVPKGTDFEEVCCWGCEGIHEYFKESIGIAIHSIGTFKNDENIKWISIVIPSAFYQKYDTNYAVYKDKPYKVIGSFKYRDVKNFLKLKKTFWINAENMGIRLPINEALEEKMFIPNQLVIKYKNEIIFDGLSSPEVEKNEDSQISQLIIKIEKNKLLTNLLSIDIQNFKNQVSKNEIQEKDFEYIFNVESEITFNEHEQDTLLKYQTFYNSISDTSLQHDNSLVYLLNLVIESNQIDLNQTCFFPKIVEKNCIPNQRYKIIKDVLVPKYPLLEQRNVECDFVDEISTMSIYLIEEYKYQIGKPIKKNILGIKLSLSANISPRGIERWLFYLPFEKIDKLLVQTIENNQIQITKIEDTNFDNSIISCSNVYISDIWKNELYGYCEYSQNIRNERIKKALVDILGFKRF